MKISTHNGASVQNSGLLNGSTSERSNPNLKYDNEDIIVDIA